MSPDKTLTSEKYDPASNSDRAPNNMCPDKTLTSENITLQRAVTAAKQMLASE
jgi:hypothetical protein